MPESLSIGEVARRIEEQEECLLQPRHVARLFETRIFPEPPRFMGNRAIPVEMIPQIIEALRARGWIRPAVKQEPANA